MRDEDLKNLPQSIEGWKVREFLEGLGIKHTDVFETTFGVRAVEIRMYASGPDGRRFPAEDGSGAAQQHITIPYVGGQTNPANDVQCPVRRNLGPTGRCTCFEGHTGDHRYPARVVRDTPLA
jgi:hypothetical protein